MKKLIILSLSLLSVSCAQASQKPDQHFSPESHARKKDDHPQVKVEESAEDMQQEVYRLADRQRKYGETCYSEAEQSCQALLISKYVHCCSKKYSNPNDAKQCSASAILNIAGRMKQNGFSTYTCCTALDQLYE